MTVALPHFDAPPPLAPERRPSLLRPPGGRPRLEVVRTSDDLSSVVLVEASPSPHDAVIASLRDHLTTLAARYAEHVGDLERRLEAERRETARAQREAKAAEARARTLAGRVQSLERALTLAETTVGDLESRNARLAEAAALPWWAFKRRRELLDGL